jgi:hypothetical protein
MAGGNEMTHSHLITRLGIGIVGLGVAASAMLAAPAPARACEPSPYCIDPSAVAGASRFPELQVDFITIEQRTTADVKLRVQMSNHGGPTSAVYSVRILVDGKALWLGPDSFGGPWITRLTFVFTLPRSPSGSAVHTIAATVDTNNDVVESNELNNTLTIEGLRW